MYFDFKVLPSVTNYPELEWVVERCRLPIGTHIETVSNYDDWSTRATEYSFALSIEKEKLHSVVGGPTVDICKLDAWRIITLAECLKQIECMDAHRETIQSSVPGIPEIHLMPTFVYFSLGQPVDTNHIMQIFKPHAKRRRRSVEIELCSSTHPWVVIVHLTDMGRIVLEEAVSIETAKSFVQQFVLVLHKHGIHNLEMTHRGKAGLTAQTRMEFPIDTKEMLQANDDVSAGPDYCVLSCGEYTSYVFPDGLVVIEVYHNQSNALLLCWEVLIYPTILPHCLKPHG